jgi:hypothetical protein
MVGLDKRVRGDHGVSEDAPARLEIVRVDVRQGLKHRQTCEDLADAAHILPVVAAVFGVAGLCGLGQIQGGDPVTVCFIA